MVSKGMLSFSLLRRFRVAFATAGRQDDWQIKGNNPTIISHFLDQHFRFGVLTLQPLADDDPNLVTQSQLAQSVTDTTKYNVALLDEKTRSYTAQRPKARVYGIRFANRNKVDPGVRFKLALLANGPFELAYCITACKYIVSVMEYYVTSPNHT